MMGHFCPHEERDELNGLIPERGVRASGSESIGFGILQKAGK